MCASGWYGSLCNFQHPRKCYVNVTQPNMAKGCRDQNEDSDDYVYSIHGYDPCHKVDFSKTYKMKYKLVCKDVNRLA